MFKYKPEWQGPLSGPSFEKQTEEFLNGIESRVDEIDTRQTPSDATPMPPGAGNAGTSGEYSRGDHSHPMQSTVSGNAGTATKLETLRTISLTGDASGSGSFDGSADCAISVSIQDATDASSGFMSAADKATLDGLEAARSSGPSVAQAQAIHVNAATGSDDNDGKTAAAAVRTLDRAFMLWNASNSPQPNIILHGKHVYETPAVAADADEGRTEGLLLYSGGAPHISGVEDSPGDGFPTLKFIFCVAGATPETVDRTSRHYVYGYNAQSTGPRFYTCHLNFSNISIDSNYNGIYFEGCSLSMDTVDFKIPCRVLSSAGGFARCSHFAEVVEVDGQSYKPFGSSVCAALYLYNSVCTIDAPTFNVEDGQTVCCGIYSKSSARVDGTVTIKPQTASGGTNYIFGIDSSSLHVSTGTISGTATNWGGGIYSAGCSQLFFNNDTMYNAWKAIGSGVVDSGNGLIKIDTYFVAGYYLAKNKVTNGTIVICNGDSASDGGGIWLYGKAAGGNAGGVNIQASNGSNFWNHLIKDGVGRYGGTYTKVYCDSQATLGESSHRWGQLYTTTAPDTSSDERLKQQIDTIPDEVLDAWGDVMWKQYKFNDAVESKGAERARLHTGLIAQNVDAVFKARGLDAAQYGLFCHDSWNAQPESVDEEGNSVAPALPAGDEFSLRYEEALCMEAAYMRRMLQRLDSRLSKLEKD